MSKLLCLTFFVFITLSESMPKNVADYNESILPIENLSPEGNFFLKNLKTDYSPTKN